jgi:hypothetical protein
MRAWWTSALRHVVLVALLGGLLGGPGCSEAPIPVQDEGLRENPIRYLRYTLRGKPSGFYVDTYPSNYLSHVPFFRPGSKVEILMYSATRIDFRVEGNDCRMFAQDLRFPTNPEGLLQTIEMHFALTREELSLEGLDPNVRRQIDAGEVAIGMTKEEVFLALGYPSHIDSSVPVASFARSRVFESSVWIYRYSEFPIVPVYTSYWTCRFGNDGRLVEVIR